jgi:hypothetical protein
MLRRRRVQSGVGAEVGAWPWWELQRRNRDGQRIGDVLGAGVGSEFEAGRVLFSRVAGSGCFGGNCGAGNDVGSGSGVGCGLAIIPLTG